MRLRKWGHVRQRRPGPGRPWTAYWSEAGERRHKPGFPSEDAAERFLREKRIEIEHGVSIAPSDVSVASYVELWIDRRRNVEPSTIRSYRSCLNSQIAPALGSVRVQALTALALDAWIGGMVDKGLAPTSIHLQFTILKAALADAVAAQVIRANPADSPIITLPKLRRKRDIVFWTEDEAAIFLEEARGHAFETLFRLLLASQLRIGEALGLPWSLVDLAGGSIRVAWNLREYDRALAQVKSTHSNRTITLDGETVRMLQAHRDRVTFQQRAPLVRPGASDLVFTDESGAPLCAQVIRNELDTLTAGAGLPRLTPHGLRHTGATLLLRAGVPLHVVSRRLGHRKASFTADVYAHVLPSQEQDAAALLGAFLDREVS